jgi:anti-sigma regulatory factor (Ser/Thr protein kinase)
MPVTAQAAWPPQTSLELLALPTAVPCARGHVRAVAREWGLADLAGTAELLTSELVTNAVRASATTSDTVRLWVTFDQASILIHVWDSSDSMPIRQDVRPDQESGRGLLLVQALASGWGTYRESGGKVVWARVSH